MIEMVDWGFGMCRTVTWGEPDKSGGKAHFPACRLRSSESEPTSRVKNLY